MRQVWIAVMLVAGCGAGADEANDAAGRGIAVQTATLTGLYEGQGSKPSQLCIVERDGEASFGIVVRATDLPSCAGAGSAARDGNRLTLAMAGDRSCTIEARIEDGKVTFPAAIPESCSYYCGEATFAGAAFTKKGGTPQDAAKALDPVGEPLCSGALSPSP